MVRSEEIGVYGSQHFVNTHQELLDRTIAALLMDGIVVSTPDRIIVLDGWSHSQFMEQVTTVALIAALETSWDMPDLRVTPEPDRRALIVGSHTEAVHIAPSALINLSRALAWEGFDVDGIPCGQSVTVEDLAMADLVVVLPVIDYPSTDGDVTVYDEAWNEEEIKALLSYVEQGGLLVLANSAHRILLGLVFDANEDWGDLNALAEPFGVVFGEGGFSSASVQTEREHPLRVLSCN